MKIVHIITSLDDGGAEHTLYKICKYDKKNKHIVISLKGSGKYSRLLKKIKIKVYSINMRKEFSLFFKFLLMKKLLIFLKPDIVQTWLVHGDFIGGIVARLAGIKYIVWNIRYSNLELDMVKFTTIIIIKILSKLSSLIPKFIIINSKRAKKIYEIQGYNKSKLKFIPNGFDLSILKPNNTKKIKFKKKVKVNEKIPLIGTVARYDPRKDHANLIKAISILKSKKINFLCVLAGNNINESNTDLISIINKFKVQDRIKLLGQNKNIPELMSGLDIYVQSSSSEGFPNVVAEAMSCKTPCVVTNVGDAALIVGDTGWVVPPKNPPALARSLKIAISNIKFNNWKLRCSQARLRIKKNFDIINMINSYNKVWKNVLQSNN
jgi:glycosyltransferase involved in cell wall biosynthesis